MLSIFFVSLILVAVSILIHGIGTTSWVIFLRSRSNVVLGSARRSLTTLVLTATSLLLLHFIELTLWAIAYLLAPNVAEIDTFEQAIYFSMVTFTTLGYGDISISGNWQLLSGVEAIDGILLCGWSTALLFVVVQRIWQELPVPMETSAETKEMDLSRSEKVN